MTLDPKFLHLQTLLFKEPQEDYPTASRIHPLNHPKMKNCFVKREDELGFGISGSKFRKYKMLIPILRSYKKVIVIGTAFSNHILGITQLLIENEIQPVLFLKQNLALQLQGNFLFLNILIPASSIHWIPSKDWKTVEKIAADKVGKEAFIINEGARLFSTFLGALSLPLDIIRNEKEKGLIFDHIFIDVGTGYNAAALILAFAYLEKKTQFHLLLLGDTAEMFYHELNLLQKSFEVWLDAPITFPKRLNFYHSTVAPSFGSTNSQIFSYIIQTSRQEGFFLDPIYSSKLFYQAHAIVEEGSIEGTTLLIHSGGALTLAGFQHPLSNYINSECKT